MLIFMVIFVCMNFLIQGHFLFLSAVSLFWTELQFYLCILQLEGIVVFPKDPDLILIHLKEVACGSSSSPFCEIFNAAMKNGCLL